MTLNQVKTQFPYRYDVVGSLLRPATLKTARAQFAAGTLSAEDLTAIQRTETKRVVQRQVELGLKAVTDGEFNRSWWHLDFLWGLTGVGHYDYQQSYKFHGSKTRTDNADLVGRIAFNPDHPFFESFRYLQSLVPAGVVVKQTIPSLAEFLTLVTNRDVQLNLELKTDKIQYPNIERIVMGMVHATALNKPVIFSSFHLPTLKTCQKLAPNEIYCWLTDRRVADPVALVTREHLNGLHLSHYQAGVPVTERIWTVDNPTVAADLMDKHVAGIFTDDFEMMMQVKQQVAN